MTIALAAPSPRFGRWTPVALVALLVAVLIGGAWSYQAVETAVAGWLIGLTSGVPVSTLGAEHLIVVNGASPEGFGLTLTNECSSLPILVALSLVSLVLLATGKVPVRRVGTSLAVAFAIAIVINLVRLAVVGWFTVRWGTSRGFSWSHVYVGSALTVLGIAVGTAGYGWVLVRRTPFGAARSSVDPTPSGSSEDAKGRP